MTTARYPKDVLLERIDAKLAGLADEQELEEQEQLQEAQRFVSQSARVSETLGDKFASLMSELDSARADLYDEGVLFSERFKAARKVADSVSRFGSAFPQPSWRLSEYQSQLVKIAKKYEVKRKFLEGKRSIINAAEAPDGFTMTALEKLHLLEAVG